jgi:hypothetical protein
MCVKIVNDEREEKKRKFKYIVWRIEGGEKMSYSIEAMKEL